MSFIAATECWTRHCYHWKAYVLCLEQCCRFNRNIAKVTPKIIYFYNKKMCLQDDSIQQIIRYIWKENITGPESWSFQGRGTSESHGNHTSKIMCTPCLSSSPRHTTVLWTHIWVHNICPGNPQWSLSRWSDFVWVAKCHFRVQILSATRKNPEEFFPLDRVVRLLRITPIRNGTAKPTDAKV